VKTAVKMNGREFSLEFEEEITIMANSTLMVEIYWWILILCIFGAS